ncbi:Up in starvation [Pleosporales sp. CAS-2024a]
MSAFHAVNTTTTTTTLTVPEPLPGRAGDETTPTTPRPNTSFFPDVKRSDHGRPEDPSVKTPTRNTFAGLAGQKPLPSSPFAPRRDVSETPSTKSELSRGNSHRSTQSVASQHDVDVEMADPDDDDKDGSDNESVTSDSNRPSKKKKGQRFHCTEFPPCNLSFTRSEHLARHIRKHTGERPFQCHCSRRFSRLDNLRQHAQTVHVNEDIPAESLAATGTRFQRQIRTDRVRPPGNRSRANTLGSTGGHSRGHSRNLSASSITTGMSSITVAQSPDVRRRPPPLAMASDGSARTRLSQNTLDAYNPPLMGSPGPQIVEYETQSNAPTTPQSATFSAATGSPAPQFGSAMQSPVSTSSRPVSWAGPPPPGRRRLSNPSGNPFAGIPGQAPPPSSFMAPLQSSSSASTFSAQSSVYASPIVSNFSESRRDSNADADWRRRTWHPGVYSGPRPATSGLGYHQTPDAPRPSFTSQPAASQTTRLPGIESFDYAPPAPSLPRRQLSPMQMDASTRPLTYHAPPPPVEYASSRGHEKRKSISWEPALQRTMNRLDHGSPNSTLHQWSSHYASSNPAQLAARPTTAPHGYLSHRVPMNAPQPVPIPPVDSARSSNEQPVTPRKNKRQAWYNGPVTQPARVSQRTSPEDSSSSEGVPTPNNTTMSEYHPAIVHSNGYVEMHPPGPSVDDYKPAPQASIMDRPHPLHSPTYPQFHRHSLSASSYRPQREPDSRPVSFCHQPLQPLQQQQQPPANDMRRLEALVAVATGEQQAVNNRS